MNKLITLLFIAFFQQVIFSQQKEDETCDSPKEEVILDLSSITKCTVGNASTTKGGNHLAIKAPTRRRVIRRRSAASSANNINATNKLEKIKSSTSLVGNLDLAGKDVAEKLPFSFVEEKPAFASCENANVNDQATCFKTELFKHIKKNFKYPTKSSNKGIQGRVLVQFVINELGDIEDVITRGPVQGEELEEEARRIINKLPKFSPGKMNGIPIKVKYGLPIGFRIPGKKATNVREKVRDNVALENVINFSTVSNIPLFKACKNKSSKDDKLACFNSQMTKHIQKHFAYPEEASNKNIEGRVYVYFVIDKDGDVVNIKTRDPKNGALLGQAAKQIMKKLPKFIPGTQDGKNANVKHAIPINFKLN